jgi:hypothetical protein
VVRPTLDGLGGNQPVVSVAAVTATISGVTIQHGRDGGGGGILNSGGTLTVISSTFSSDATIAAGGGGAIASSNGNLTVIGSTFSGNTATFGGAIYSGGGTLSVVNSTFSSNDAAAGGAGSAIYNTFGGSATVVGSTFSSNSSGTSSGTICTCGGGTTTLAADLLATPGGPTTGGNCAGPGTIPIDAGYNMSDDASCGFSMASSLNSSTAAEELGALADNGGPTQPQTIAPTTGNPAIGAIPNPTSGAGTPLCPTTDERGATSPVSGCTVGAVQIPGGQIITFTSTSPPSATVGGVTYTPAATASSGLAVAFTISASAASVCSINGSNVVSFTGVGTCVIDANQAGNTTWSIAPQVVQSFIVAGYWEVAADGGIFSFGSAPFHGSMGGKPLNAPVVGMAATNDYGGYDEVASDGGIFCFGDAQFYGSKGGKALPFPIVAMAVTTDGRGYWEIDSVGNSYAFGDAPQYGSYGGDALPAPIAGIATNRAGTGFFVAIKNGGVATAGNAISQGSLISLGIKPNKPIVGIAANPATTGYWETGADGGVYAFGSAGFFGSAGNVALNKPVVGMATPSSGTGYWLVASDGGIFAYGGVPFSGSMGGRSLNAPVVGMASAS